MSLTMHPVSSDAPKHVRARGEYDCSAKRCLVGRSIARGEVHVSVRDFAPQTPDRGRPRPDLKWNNFQVRYHERCFIQGNTNDSHTSTMSYELADLAGYEQYRNEIAALLAEG